MSDESELMVMEAEAALAEGELWTPPRDEYTADAVTGIFTRGFSAQSERDKQVKLGASEIGGCPYCVGHTMAQKLPDPPPKRGDDFGYAAWIGTMCHYWLEHNLVLTDPLTGEPLETLREFKVTAGTIGDYGTLNGNLDLYVAALRRTFDYKFPGKFSYDKVKLAIKKGNMALEQGKPLTKEMMPSSQYRYQQQMYAHGLVAQGYEVETCRIIFLPRHGNNLQDVLHWEEPYNPAMVELAFNRAEQIWEQVKDGELAELESDPDCYTCDTYGR